jgi:DNA recombination protein RmuC
MFRLMDMSIIIAIAAIFVGLGAGYWLGGLPTADLRARLGERDEEFRRAAAELGEAQIELSAARERAARADR